MDDIVVVLDRTYDASPDVAFAALADYADTRPRITPPEITDFEVLEGGTGAGTRFACNLHARKNRVRHIRAEVTEPEPGRQLLESDANSSLAVFWNVAPAAAGRSRVTVRVSWQGATGVGGFFERRFAPGGIERIYSTGLDRLGEAIA